MIDVIKELSNWFFRARTRNYTRCLEEKLQEAYRQGKKDAYHEQVEITLNNILMNTMRDINLRKKELYENNFYKMPSEEDVIQMRAYEYLTENLGRIIKEYREG